MTNEGAIKALKGIFYFKARFSEEIGLIGRYIVQKGKEFKKAVLIR